MTGVDKMNLFRIPASKWISETIQKMVAMNAEDVSSWTKYWLDTYYELGGISTNNSGKNWRRVAASPA